MNCLEKSLKLFIYQKLSCDTKKKFGGAILKSLSFSTGCADFAKKSFKVAYLQASGSFMEKLQAVATLNRKYVTMDSRDIITSIELGYDNKNLEVVFEMCG